MNKTLTISVVAALGIAGGGAYMLMDSDNNYSEYVPEIVSSMAGDYLPDSLKVVPAVETSAIIEESVQIEQQVQEEAQMQEDMAVADSQTEAELEPVAEQQEAQQEMEQNGDGDNAVEIAMDEIQKSINEVSAPELVEITTNNPKAKKLAKKIDDASMEISKLDAENKELEAKFQNILRKNRELAKQLQDIDKQLANSN